MTVTSDDVTLFTGDKCTIGCWVHFVILRSLHKGFVGVPFFGLHWLMEKAKVDITKLLHCCGHDLKPDEE